MRERPIGDVARDLTRDVSLLVRQEVELAKAEMAEKGRVAAPGLGMIGGAGVVGLMAAGALTASLILVLSIFLPEWASALAVGGVLAAIAYVLAKQGKERVSEAGAPIPEQTMLKEQSRSKLSETLDERTTQAGGQARQMAQVLQA